MDIELLADNPQAAKTVARWYFDKWVSETSDITIDALESEISSYVNRKTAPMILLAKIDGVVVGAAQLKIREMDIYPEYEFWLGGVYVDETVRGKGIASLLASKIVSQAKAAGIKKLYLQTVNLTGGLYQKLGFRPIEVTRNNGDDVLVMVAETGA